MFPDDDEEKARLKQEAKEREKKRKQAELRLQRMQRFEARSELQEVETEGELKKYRKSLIRSRPCIISVPKIPRVVLEVP